MSMSLAGLYNFLSGQAERTAMSERKDKSPVSQAVHSELAQRMSVWNEDMRTELHPLPLICQNTPLWFWVSYCHLIAIPNYILNSI